MQPQLGDTVVINNRPLNGILFQWGYRLPPVGTKGIIKNIIKKHIDVGEDLYQIFYKDGMVYVTLKSILPVRETKLPSWL